MIEKAYAIHVIKAVYSEDSTILESLHYPPISVYCREYLAGYRTSVDILWRLDIDLARHVLHRMRQRHNDEYLLLRGHFRDGKGVSRNPLNAALRVFRRDFEAASDRHSTPQSAV